ncbi:MAG TPA: hypothetical protein VKA86_17895 [Candidatus Krumholzibacteria bacterium]|nr:hypothetical protein [Candidatus Krumholzibacteria bacterium]
MSREREKILRMVADGTITPDEAEQLLNRLDPRAPTAVAEPSTERGERPPGPIKYLRVVINGGDDKVNVRVPIALIRTGIKLSTLMPNDASEHLRQKGIDLGRLNELDGDELMDALRELWVEVESEDGDTIRVFCE